jgi:hypothetical protein
MRFGFGTSCAPAVPFLAPLPIQIPADVENDIPAHFHTRFRLPAALRHMPHRNDAPDTSSRSHPQRRERRKHWSLCWFESTVISSPTFGLGRGMNSLGASS